MKSSTVIKNNVIYLYVLNQKAVHKYIQEGEKIKLQNYMSIMNLFI